VRGDVVERVLCLDTGVLIKYLTPDEQEETATALELASLEDGAHVVAPGFCWAEVGSVMRKKVRAGLLQANEAAALWFAFLDLPIKFVEEHAVRVRTWELAEKFGMATLYDAAFLACTEVAPGNAEVTREFWTADDELLRALGAKRPAYVRRLGERE